MNEERLRAASLRVEALLDQLARETQPAIRDRIEELVRLLMDIQGAGLSRILEIVRAREGGDLAGTLGALADDPLVAALLLLHGLHPDDAVMRVQRALERARPLFEAQGLAASVVEVDLPRAVARIRLDATHAGGNARVDWQPAIQRIVQEAAPEIVRVDLEGLARPAPAALSLIQITRPTGEPIELRQTAQPGPAEAAPPAAGGPS